MIAFTNITRVTDDFKWKEIHHNRWDDFTPELWAEGNLKYLRDEALPFDQEFAYDPAMGCFEFQKQQYQPNIMQEGFIFCADDFDAKEQPSSSDSTSRSKTSDIAQCHADKIGILLLLYPLIHCYYFHDYVLQKCQNKI